jgi:hypothetical protein
MPFVNNIMRCIILCVTKVIPLLVMATSPSEVMFRRDLIGPRLDAWNVLLQCLASIQLSPGSDVFRWNLHVNGNFSVDSYKLIYQLIITRRFGR